VVGTFPCPSETFVVDHVTGLERAGWAPTILCDRVDPEWLADLTRRTTARFDVQVVPAATSSVASLVVAAARAVPIAARALRVASSLTGLRLIARAAVLGPAILRLRPAVVHAHYADNGIATALAIGHRLPLVVDFHGWDFNILPSLIGWQSMSSTLRGSTLVAHSDFAERRIREGTRLDVRRVRLGVDLHTFRAPPRSGVWPSHLKLLVVGRLVRIKGQAVAIRALASLRRAPVPLDASLTLVGEGPERAACLALARTLGVADHVHLTGAQQHADVAAQMASADILLVPSVRGDDGAEEGFGRVAIEGLASGLPVVVSAIGGLPEAIGDAGWTVPPADPDALAARITSIVRERTPAACREGSVRRAAEFTLARMANDYLAVTEKACARD
jgi:glycosyltransferase involved in cell wall biosynthesis